mmetsp:Transcript_13882/g.18531  ORF Transcript_13882/g.18531 Transcript_13882/m.18531 type:complete len:377 (+) Transcript_13882:30-1160(+)|eukprot:CAMPEP_0197331674 /NCGR_PEP_ID=MMETSP0892-20130614/12402_1 /TAXON_ID=44058 ORGANISM="Aureoumbra lagunensis, Strain CCMP1510" /NCGR_SAMPLE_ID=MMETSP0892 /ASSEMBLY_ACC=CAM_ASM_000538 /LENGTH=376 /DNA_ID=CAMNT_0042829729 /DNA_START=6 /DNA_END=1136 /DNA_ORIENTATION=-
MKNISVKSWKSRATWDWVFTQVFDCPQGESSIERKIRRMQVTIRWDEGAKSFAADGHGLDGLEDKDEMVVTLAALHLEKLCPRSQLLVWTCTTSNHVEQILERDFFNCLDHNDPTTWPVLKAPCGSRGDGIYLVSSVHDIANILEENAKQAIAQGSDFIQGLKKNRKDQREPAYVLQQQISNQANESRISIRVYLLITKQNQFIYSIAESRAAPYPYSPTNAQNNRSWFFTNGNGREDADRNLVNLLQDHSTLSTVFSFISGLDSEFKARMTLSESDQYESSHFSFCFGALDLMHDQRTGQTLLLEVNRAPAAPPEHGLSSAFRTHLINLALSLIHIVRNEYNETPHIKSTTEHNLGNKEESGRWISASHLTQYIA